MTSIKTATGLQAVYGEGKRGEYIGENPLMGVMTEAGKNPTGSFWQQGFALLFQPDNSTKVFELPTEAINPLFN